LASTPAVTIEMAAAWCAGAVPRRPAHDRDPAAAVPSVGSQAFTHLPVAEFFRAVGSHV